jgi:hypothetical protein
MSLFLSIADLTTRWSCGRTFVYAALREMEDQGYLRRLWLGRVQRVALEAVERWETLHSQGPAPARVAPVLAIRKRRPRVVSARGPSITEAWRAASALRAA